MYERHSTLEADRQSPPEVEEQGESVATLSAETDASPPVSTEDRTPATDAHEAGRALVLTRVLIAAVLILGAGAAGYGASRTLPLPSGWIWSPPAWNVPPQEAKTFSRRTQPKLVKPEAPVMAVLPAPAALNSSQQPPLGQTTVNGPVKTDNGPAASDAFESMTREATAGAVRVAPPDVSQQDDGAQRRSWRAAREQVRSRGAAQLADSVPSGSRQDPALKSFMATPNNF
jgi:hypothetical protein